jgi:HYR domain-containing protein/FG-GAP repeat protein
MRACSHQANRSDRKAASPRRPKRLALLSIAIISATGLAAGAFFKQAALTESSPTAYEKAAAGLSSAVSAKVLSANPRLKLESGREVEVTFEGSQQAVALLAENRAKAVSLASGDLDGDGVADLAVGYRTSSGGMIAIYRGREEAIYGSGSSDEGSAEARRDSPFESAAKVVELTTGCDLLAVGDYNADGWMDVMTAARGESRLGFILGDGLGGLGEHYEMNLSGSITELQSGDVNRADSLADIVIGIKKESGYEVNIFQSPRGAIGAIPNILPAPGHISSIALGRFDEDYLTDVAVACGNALMILGGQDQSQPQSSSTRGGTHLFPSRVKSITAGDFANSAGSGLAVLTDQGSIYSVSVKRAAGRRGKEGLTAMAVKSELLSEGEWPESSKLFCVGSSSLPGDELAIIESTSRITLVEPALAKKGKTGRKSTLLGEADSIVRLDLSSEATALLPMRLNEDALDDLVLLRAGHAGPIVVTTTPAAIFQVMSNADNGAGTLRQAIMDANMTAGADTINFQIGSGPQTINLMSPLPVITETLTINGTTQPGSMGNPIIEINGQGAGAASDGLVLNAPSCVVRGLVINRFGGVSPNGNGILTNGQGGHLIERNFIGTDINGSTALPNFGSGIRRLGGSSIQIGGPSIASRNIISGNGGSGISINGGSGNTIQGNFIGTTAGGNSALPNSSSGVILQDSVNNTVGGTAAGAGNTISGNAGSGVLITAGGSMGNQVQGNLIGTNAAGNAALGNLFGVQTSAGSSNNTIGGAGSPARNVISGNTANGVSLGSGSNIVRGNFIGITSAGNGALGNGASGLAIVGSTSNQIGGTAPGEGNVISSNQGSGVEITDSAAMNNLVIGNLIGTNAGGTAALGNIAQGVSIGSSRNNSIGDAAAGMGNVIAFNGLDGIAVQSGMGNALLVNQVFSNGGLGIDLGPDGVTPNDPGDVDSGGNGLQNFPVITSATNSGGNVTIVGTLNSMAGQTYRIEFFSNQTCDVSGNGEGRNFLGSTNVATDSSGNAPINVTLPFIASLGSVITTTATDPANNTSEFSQCVTVMAPSCTITCPPDRTVSSSANQCGSNVNYPDPTVMGSCGTVSCTPPSGSFFATGITRVTCTSPGSGGCSFNVTVVDNVVPVITCPENIVRSGAGSTVVDYPIATATDNCPGATVVCLPPSGTVFPFGTTPVNCTARDVSNNTAICIFTITIRDAASPTINCPANVVAQAPTGQNSVVVTYPQPTVSDNLPGATVACAPPSGSTFALGVTTVNCTATDAAGNRASCAFRVTVGGGQPVLNIIIDGNKPAVEFGDLSPLEPRRKPQKNSVCVRFTIANLGFSPAVLTYESLLRTGADVVANKIADPNDVDTFTVTRINANGSETELTRGTTITIQPGASQAFCMRFVPLIPAVAQSLSGLKATDVLPDLVTSRLNFSLAGGSPAVVNIIGHVAAALKLINPTNPRKAPVVRLTRSGNELIAAYSIYDPDLDVTKAKYEFLNSGGQIVGQPIEVDLAGELRRLNLVRGQSFTVEQRFTGAQSHPEITGVRITVFDGEGSVTVTVGPSGSQSASAEKSLRYERSRSRLYPPPVRLR